MFSKFGVFCKVYNSGNRADALPVALMLRACWDAKRSPRRHMLLSYGQFSKCHVCFCGLDPGNLKFETVRTHKQHICF